MGTKTPDPAVGVSERDIVTGRNLRFGWWSLLVFLALGIVIESLYSLKVSAYLDVANSTRRLMWTLAHAHGTLFSLLNIAFAITVNMVPGWTARSRQFASRCLIAATIIMPAGFFLGGVVFYSGDPGLGILLVPVGALALLAGVYSIGRGVRFSKKTDSESRHSRKGAPGKR